MSTSLEKTYDYLGTTANDAAVDVLAETLVAAGPRARRMSIATLLQRNTPRAFEALLDAWPKIKESERQLLGEPSQSFAATVANAITAGTSRRAASAIEIAAHLSIHDSIPQLAQMAESSNDPLLQKLALRSVLAMARNLGTAARDHRDRPLLRRRVIDRLAISVRSIDIHRCEELIDAFLSVSVWSDSLLQAILDANGKSAETLSRRLMLSPNGGVIDLLAGWITKSRIPDAVVPLLQARTDARFRDAVLRHVGGTPSQRSIRYLEQLKTMAAFEPNIDLLGETAGPRHAALLHVVFRLQTDRQAVRDMAIQMVETGDDDAVRTAAMVLRQLGPLPWETIRPEAQLIAQAMNSGSDYEAVFDGLLWRQIQLLDFPCEHVQKAVRKSLHRLTVESFLEPDSSLQFGDLFEIGPVLRLIDPMLEQGVIEGLKHPLIETRCRAIDAAAGLGLIDSLFDTLQQIYDQDHLTVRIQIAGSLRYASSSAVQAWRDELKSAASGPVRDAAHLGSERLQEIY